MPDEKNTIQLRFGEEELTLSYDDATVAAEVWEHFKRMVAARLSHLVAHGGSVD